MMLMKKNEFDHLVLHSIEALLLCIKAGLHKFPMFSPLKINRIATNPIIKGYHLNAYLFITDRTYFPMIEVAKSSGTVPVPKLIIKKLPKKGDCIAVAPANATYTMPHGNMPFNTPAIIFDEIDSVKI
jgi:hypothetical protein